LRDLGREAGIQPLIVSWLMLIVKWELTGSSDTAEREIDPETPSPANSFRKDSA